MNAEAETKPRREVRRTGVVVSDRMAKTIVVRVDRKVMHPVYKKYMRRSSKLVAHDEKNEAKTGDTVEIVFTRPISRTKRWRLERVIAAIADRAGKGREASP
jgi:small subunit ribosomal protein S17